MPRAWNGDDIGTECGGESPRSLLGDERVIVGVNDCGGSQKRPQLTGAHAVEKAVQSGDEEMVELRLTRRRELLREGRDGDEGRQVPTVAVHRPAARDDSLDRPQRGQAAKTVRHDCEPRQPVWRRPDSLGDGRRPGRGIRSLRMRELRHLNMGDGPCEPGKPVVVGPRPETVDEGDSVELAESVGGTVFCNVVHAPGR